VEFLGREYFNRGRQVSQGLVAQHRHLGALSECLLASPAGDSGWHSPGLPKPPAWLSREGQTHSRAVPHAAGHQAAKADSSLHKTRYFRICPAKHQRPGEQGIFRVFTEFGYIDRGETGKSREVPDAGRFRH
jgi:hypothetical protein